MYGEHVLADGDLRPHRPRRRAGVARCRTASPASSPIAILTYFHIVIGEMVPKSLALQQAERLALWITPPMLWTKNVVFPFVVGAERHRQRRCCRLLGVNRQAQSTEQYYTPEELQLIVQESEELGAMRAESGQMLQELFEFGDLTAGQVMVPRVRITGIPVGTHARTRSARCSAGRRTRAIPIIEQDLDHIVGMIHIKDLLRLLLQRTSRSAARTRGRCRSCPRPRHSTPCWRRCGGSARRWSVVIDEHGGTAGVVTLEDLFEEVVGEIEEGPGPAPQRYRDREGRLRVPGTMRIDELGQEFDLELEHEEVDSVSGLVLTLLGRPPHVGDTVRYDRLLLEVTAVKGHGVEECAVCLVA